MKRQILFAAVLSFSVASCSSSYNSMKKLSNNSKLMSDVNYYEGLKQYYSGTTDNAIKFMNRAISLNRENDATYFILSQIYQGKNQRVEALKNAELAFTYSPDNEDYGLNFAQNLQRLNRLDSALNVYSQLIAKDSANTDLLLNMSLIYGVKGDIVKSIRLYDEFSSRYGNNETILENKQKLYLQFNQLDSAISVGNKLIELFPDNPRHFALIADIYSNKGNDSLAIDYNIKALELVPTFPLAQIGLSDAYRREVRYAEYFRMLNKIFKNDDIKNSDKVNYFNQFLENKQFYQVFYPNIDTLITNFIVTYPKDTSIYPIYAEHMGKLGKLGDLNTFLMEKLDSGSKDSALFFKFIELNLYTKRFDTTSFYASKAISIYPKLVKLYLYKSYALFQKKDFDSTIFVLKTALPYVQSDSIKVDILSMIGDSYHSLGNDKDAFTYYDEALSVNPANIQVLNNYSYYLSLVDRKLAKALKMINIVLKKEPNNSTYLDTKAWLLYKLGKYDEAKVVMRQALLYGGNESDTILEHYGDILFKLKEIETAKLYWQMSYDKGNRSEEILRKLNLK
jgi:tetratricopeptide (TPR) repeat protein